MRQTQDRAEPGEGETLGSSWHCCVAESTLAGNPNVWIIQLFEGIYSFIVKVSLSWEFVWHSFVSKINPN